MGSRDEVAATRLLGGGEVAVVGESYHQVALSAFCGGRTEDGHEQPAMAALVLEPTNPHDPNAVAVHLHGGGKVGHLGRGDAARYGPALRLLAGCGSVGVCDATIRGGWDRGGGDAGNFGVELDLAGPDEVLAGVVEGVAEYRRLHPDAPTIEVPDSGERSRASPLRRRGSQVGRGIEEPRTPTASIVLVVLAIVAFLFAVAMRH